MRPLTDVTAHEREDIRLEFYRDHRGQPGFGSVAVRRDGDGGGFYIDVGATAPPPHDWESTYRGLPVRVSCVPHAVNAVAPAQHTA